MNTYLSLHATVKGKVCKKKNPCFVQAKLKILSLGITVRHHSESLVNPNSYPCNGIFNLHLITIKDSNNLPYSGYGSDRIKTIDLFLIFNLKILEVRIPAIQALPMWLFV